MFVLGLITCVVLRAFSAQAKVVHSFEECKMFFYKGIEPSGMDQNAKKICQMLENRGFYYATLYSVHHKIPLYSAYTLDPKCSSSHGRTKDWRLEPQISQPGSQTDYMVRENQNNKNLYKGNQAISSDYRNTTYDRGHLNPSCFQCGDGRKATFTLTNAAPMNRHFNQIHWNNWESTLRGYLIEKLDRDGGFATAFIVTGTVPDPNVRIPHRGTSEEPERVSVPSHIWTAVCYKHDTDNSKSLSFGYIGKNQPAEPDIRLMSVSDLNDQLSGLYREFSGTDQSISYMGRNHPAEPHIRRMSVSDLNDELSGFYSELPGTHQSVEIFVDDCFGDDIKLVEFQKLINLPVSQAVQISSEIQNTYIAVKRTFSSDSIPEEKVNVNENTGKIAFDSMSTYFKLAEDLKIFTGSACLITNAKPQVRKMHDELRKREVSAGPDAVECQLVPEKQKTAADGSRCSSVTESDYICQCNTGSETKPCCSSPCLYMDGIKGYRCYSDQKLIECSPPYSLITVNGDRCLDDYPCATYGEDYYWCWTTYNPYFLDFEWDYCSPPLKYSKAKNGKYCRSNHACAKYGSKYTWCYTDDEGKYDKCCTSDDCYSTVNHKTCRSDHACGYHDYNYLWCYTDREDNWDYCCRNCRQ